MDAVCPSAIEPLARIWTALHRDLDVEIGLAEARYLRGVVLGMDDELVARLLAAKISMARVPAANAERTRIRTGSEVTYAIKGRALRATLVHGSCVGDGRIGVGTRFGAAMIGQRSGQSLLWPMERGRLVELRVLEVTPPLGKRWGAGEVAAAVAKTCVLG